MKNNKRGIKPVFIIGAPRSGTTLLYNILCNHRDLSFFTLNLLRAGVYRKGRILGYRKELLVRIQNLVHRDRLSVQPDEATVFWSKFFGTYNYLTESDCTQEMTDHYLRVVATVQAIFNRPRFINKNPQHCFRVRILNKIFPDAKFIHIIREGDAVACSTFAKVREEPPTNSYSISLMDKILPLLLDKDSSISLTDIQRYFSEIQVYGLARDVLISKAREAQAFGSSRYYEINYEELVSESKKRIKEILNFCELDSYQEFEDRLPEIRNENLKWEKLLKTGQPYFL
jgi:hypothetical protein